MILLWLVTATGAWADNMVSILTTEGAPRTEVTVSISLDNTDMVSSLQVTIPVDDNLTVVEGSGLPTSRCPNHTVAVSKVDGQIQVYIYSLSMASLSGSSDVVATFKMKLGDRPGWYELIPSKVVLTDAEGTLLNFSASGTWQEIRGPYLLFWGMENVEDMNLGGVPTNEKTIHGLSFQNVGNAELVVTGLMFSDVKTFTDESQLEYPYTIQPGEWGYMNIGCLPTSRQPISQTMTVLCNSTTSKNMLRLKAQPYVVNVLTVEPASGTSDEEITISMTMKNEDAVSGYQVEFEMPRSLQFIEGSFALSDRKVDHTSMVSFADNKLRIIVYSPTDSPFSGNSGEIGSFKVKPNGRESTELRPTNVILSATINNKTENVCSDWHGGYISIICPYIVGEDKLYFGNIPVTSECIAYYRLYNMGPVPLVVSRIVFDNEYLSVDGPMPLTIDPWVEKYITVRYNSLEEVPFEAVMQIHSNDPEMRLKEVKLTGERFAPNYINVAMPNINTESEARILISMDNYDPIYGVQFDVEYPQDFFMPYDDNCILAPELEGMMVDINRIDEKTMRYILYSISGESIERGSNKLMSIAFKPRYDATPEGTYSFFVRNIKLGTSDMVNKYAGFDFNIDVNVWNMLPGDANTDSRVDVADIVEIVNYILDNPSERFVFTTADVNTDGEVNVTDVVQVVSIIMSNSFWASSISYHRAAEVADLSMYTAAQFDLKVAAGTAIDDIRLVKSMEHSHQLVCMPKNATTYTVLVYSLSNQLMRPENGAIVNVNADSAQEAVVMENATVVTPAGDISYFQNLSSTTGVRQIESENAPTFIYDLKGSQLDRTTGLAKGIYIINNKKMVVR